MKYTLITGAANGLGKKIAIHFAKKGKNLCLQYYSSEKEALALKEELESTYQIDVKLFCMNLESFTGDSSSIGDLDTSNRLESSNGLDLSSAVTSQVEQNSALNELKSLSIEVFIHRVGSYLETDLGCDQFQEMSQELTSINKCFSSNLYSSYFLTKQILPSLIKESGNVIYFGMAGINAPTAKKDCMFYAMAKTSLLIMMKSFAKEYASKLVQFNMISPGYLENTLVSPKIYPMERPANSNDIIESIEYFLNNSYITGQNLEVSGGICL